MQVAPVRAASEIDPDYWVRRVAEEGFTWGEMEQQFGDIPGFCYWLLVGKPDEHRMVWIGDPAEEYMRLIRN